MTDGAVALNNRWIKVSPSGYVPAYACVEVTGTSLVGDDLVVNVKKPSADNLQPSKVMFISSCGILGGEVGLGTYSFPCWASATSAATVGSILGTQEDSFLLGLGKRGFYCEGSSDGKVRIKPQPYFDDEDCDPTEWIYSARYECDENPYYVDSTSGSYIDGTDSYDCCDWTNPRGYLNEYLDYYEWDKDRCEWLLRVAQEANRTIACCDPRCADSTSEQCRPCAHSNVPSGNQCCGTDFTVTVNWTCGQYSGEVQGQRLPTKVWIEERNGPGASNDPYTKIGASEQTNQSGFESYTYTLNEACASGDIHKEYIVRYQTCGEEGVIARTNMFTVYWIGCVDPSCSFCPDDAQQTDHDPENFSIVGTVSGNVEADVVKAFTYNDSGSFWEAEFTVVATDAITPSTTETITFCVRINCWDGIAAGSPGFDALFVGGDAVYCEGCALSIPSVGGWDNSVGYGSNLEISSFSANDIIDTCGGTTLPNGNDMSLTVAIGDCI
jgi:hypothetical protein